ncbi:MAG: hypothetical protein KAR20_22085, partial [Candidatus Heimdallarchaeota archaeon]|nr:hypothetical protein [Candidatus Heimdallarchaeota archaeon]
MRKSIMVLVCFMLAISAFCDWNDEPQLGELGLYIHSNVKFFQDGDSVIFTVTYVNTSGKQLSYNNVFGRKRFQKNYCIKIEDESGNVHLPPGDETIWG